MSSTKDHLLFPVASKDAPSKSRTKVTVVGVGAVGMASAFSLMHICGEIVLIDVIEDKVKGEVLDLQHGQQFLQRCKVSGGSNYELSANSDIVVITAGARQSPGETRLNLVQRNVDIYKSIIKEIVKYNPNCIIIVVSNPVDVLTRVVAKLSGFPKNRVIGTGTMLDSARFRYLLGEKLGVSASSVHGYIIGEHGDSSVALWDSLNVAGVRLASANPAIGSPNDPDSFDSIHKEVIRSAYDIIQLKGYTSWAIGLTVRSLCNSILNNLHTVYPLSVAAKNYHGIEDDVYISLPCLVTSNGISHVIKQTLNDKETQQLRSCAKGLNEVFQSIKW